MKIVASVMQRRKGLVPMDAMLHQTCCGHYPRRTDEAHGGGDTYASVEAATEAMGGDVYCCPVCLRGRGRHLKW